jgi:enoyl-CoA hydratase
MSINLEEKLIVTEIDENKICTITFNNPKSLNALSGQVLTELKESLLNLKAQNILGVILTGAGEKAFVAGADIKEMLSMSNEDALSFSLLGQEVTTLMESLEVPVIACVNGFALGGGLEMALGADFIYCSQNAVFGLPEVKLGLIPGFGGTQRLARVVGRNIAREIIYTGKNLNSEEALAIGLVNKIFNSTQELLEGAKDLLVKIQRNSIFAIGKAKLATLNGIDLDLVQGLKVESDMFAGLFESFDAKEGTQAFAEKRAAKFQHMK